MSLSHWLNYHQRRLIGQFSGFSDNLAYDYFWLLTAKKFYFVGSVIHMDTIDAGIDKDTN